MDALLGAWANVSWLVFNWLSSWWSDIDGAMKFLERIGD